MAMIIFSQKYKGHLAMVVPADKARKIQDTLDNPPDEISAEQEDFLLAIKHIYHGKRTENRDVTEKLTNPGVLQGMSEIIPRGDR